MTQNQLRVFTVLCILVSAFVGWSIGQVVLRVAHTITGGP